MGWTIYVSVGLASGSPTVRPLIERLRGAFPEHRFLLPEDVLSPGSEWRDQIGRVIGTCDLMLVMVSPQGLERAAQPQAANTSAEFEVGLARSRRVDILPILLDGANWRPLPGDLGELSRLQAQRFSNETAQQDFNDIQAYLSHRLQRREAERSEMASAPAARYDANERKRADEFRAREIERWRQEAAARQAAQDAEYSRRMATPEGDIPPTIASPVISDEEQARRDGEYRRRMSSPQGEVPPTLASAEAYAAGDAPLNGTLSTFDMLGAAARADAGKSRGPSVTARPPPPPPAPFPAARAPATSAPPPRSAPTVSAAPPPPPSYRPEAHAPSRAASGKTGLFLGAAAVAILAIVPLLNPNVRDALGQSLQSMLAALGIKLNAFSFFGLFKKQPREAAKFANMPPPTTDLVDCSVFAPPAAPPGSTVMLQVFLHIPEHKERARFQANVMDDTAVLKGAQSLQTPIARGATVSISLDPGGAQIIDEPVQTVIWRGEPVFVQFLVQLPHGMPNTSIFPKVRISVGGGLVGCIAFRMALTEQASGTRSVQTGDSARRYKHAFLSYATADRREVLKRAQVLRAAGVSFFQDILSLDPGDRWEQEIFRNIDECDLFLLFWSKSARDSAYVLKEAEYALSRQRAAGGNMPDIVPVIIEGPPVILPPPSLSSIHFNDKIAYLVASS